MAVSPRSGTQCRALSRATRSANGLVQRRSCSGAADLWLRAVLRAAGAHDRANRRVATLLRRLRSPRMAAASVAAVREPGRTPGGRPIAGASPAGASLTHLYGVLHPGRNVDRDPS